MIPYETASKYYSTAAQTFVLMCSQIITEEMVDRLCGDDNSKRALISTGGGRTQIIAPDGQIISNVVPSDEEGIAYAEIDLEMIIYSKYAVDPAGHYSVPGVLSLNFNQNPQPPVHRTGNNKREIISFNELQEA
jgi:hypothetical protein